MTGDGGRHEVEGRQSFGHRLGVPEVALFDCIRGQAWLDVLGNVRDQESVVGALLRLLVGLGGMMHEERSFVNSLNISFMPKSCLQKQDSF